MLKSTKGSFVARAVLATTIMLAALLALPSGAQAYSFNLLQDNFSSLALKPDPAAKWWIINWGADANGGQSRVEDYCSDHTCVQIKNDGFWNKYVRLNQTPGQAVGPYYNAEIAELQSGFAYGQPTRWNPEVGKPVTMTTRVRWSPNYIADGTGSAIGSSGVWLWNSPIDLVGAFNPVNAIGFQWAPSNSAAVPGLNFGVFNNTYPEAQFSMASVDMSKWHNFSVVWSVNSQGTQRIDAWVDATYLGGHNLSSPISDLSVEIWNDNQRPTFTGIEYDQVTSEQFMDVDYIIVAKP